MDKKEKKRRIAQLEKRKKPSEPFDFDFLSKEDAEFSILTPEEDAEVEAEIDKILNTPKTAEEKKRITDALGFDPNEEEEGLDPFFTQQADPSVPHETDQNRQVREGVSISPDGTINMDVVGNFTPKDHQDSTLIDPTNKQQTDANLNIDGVFKEDPEISTGPRDVFNEKPNQNILDVANRLDPVQADLEVEGFFAKKPEIKAEDIPIVSQLKEALASGDTEAVNELANTARNVSSIGDIFRKDLSPEAMLVDRLRARTQRRQGQPETNQLTRTGQFEGEKRSPYDLKQKQFSRDLNELSTLGKIDASDKKALRKRLLDLAKKKQDSEKADKTELKERNRLAVQVDNIKRKNEELGLKRLQNDRENLKMLGVTPVELQKLIETKTKQLQDLRDNAPNLPKFRKEQIELARDIQLLTGQLEKTIRNLGVIRSRPVKNDIERE